MTATFSPHRRRKIVVTVATAAVVISIPACSERAPVTDPRPGTLVIVTTGDADVLFPPLVTNTTARQVTELVYDYLAEVGTELHTTSDKAFQPRLAESWKWSSDSMSIAFRIHPEAKWHDGRPVRADDVRFTFNLYNDSALASPMRSDLTNIDSVSVLDSITAVFWFRKRSPLQFFAASSQIQILPKHIFERVRSDSLRNAAASIKPIGSGRYRFVRWNVRQTIELAADSGNYRGTPKIGRLIWRITPSATTATTMLLAGEADLYDTMRPDNVREAARKQNVYVISQPGADFVFMELNFKDPLNGKRAHRLFASRDLRRALAMSVDRSALVRNVFDTFARPAIGPTVRAFPSTDTTLVQLNYAPDQARKILDSLGWRTNKSTGIRERSGKPLRFRLLVPGSSENRKHMAVLIQAQLKQAGIVVDLDQMDWTAFSERLAAHHFDAALASWNVGTNPAAAIRIWTTKQAVEEGGLNYSSYSSPRFDAYVDSATSQMDSTVSRQFYTKAYQTAIDDAPAIWLYEPRTVLGLNKRVHIGPVRADAWWFSLADWSVR